VIGFVAVGAVLWATRGLLVEPADLAVGDCLFVRTTTNQAAGRPIGEPRDVAATVLAGGAERASCSASHGHEVSAVIPVAQLGDSSREAPARCASAFAGYVGHPLDRSIYVTFPVVPDATDPAPVVVCLVARGDGAWMGHPARGSGE
jgi:hypothetical protein